MNTKALAAVACLWLPVVASAADDQDVTAKLDTLSQKFEKILSSTGISIGGQVTAGFGASDMSGNGEDPTRRSDEPIGFTQTDFDLRARPNSVTQARAVFRLYLDDASFFGSPYTPFETRWLSIDGSAQDGMLYYHLGSIQEKWSPLTIWSPDPSFVYTPRVFAQEQQTAENERFLGNNVRNLTGFNIGLRAAVPQAKIDSFDVHLLAAKLLTGAALGDPASELISKINSSADGTTGYPDSLANFDRWAVGGRGTITFLGAFNLGANFLGVKDLKSTYGMTDTAHRYVLKTVTAFDSTGGVITKRALQASPTYTQLLAAGNSDYNIGRDSLAQNGRVISFQAGADIGKAIGNKSLVLDFQGELALSSWDVVTGRTLQNIVGTKDSTTHVTGGFDSLQYDTGYYAPVVTTYSGSALNLDLRAGWKGDDWTAVVRVGYLLTDSAFRSDLAQTPVFNQALGRIYNSDQDGNGLLHYNTFDALYDNVHRWVAEDQNEYAKSPYDKLAYTNYVGPSLNPALGGWTSATASAAKQYATDKFKVDSILVAGGDTTGLFSLKQEKLALYQTALEGAGFDRDLQLVLPGGESSPNRVGPKFGFEGNILNGGVEALVSGYMLQEVKGTVLDSGNEVAQKATFQQVQGGVRLRLDRFLPKWNTLLNPKNPIPLELSASAGIASAKGGTALDYSSTEIAASAYVGILPRLSLLGGYQTITGKDKIWMIDQNVSDMAAGLEFKIQEGAYFEALYSLLKTEYPNAPEYNFEQSIWSTKISVSF